MQKLNQITSDLYEPKFTDYNIEEVPEARIRPLGQTSISQENLEQVEDPFANLSEEDSWTLASQIAQQDTQPEEFIGTNTLAQAQRYNDPNILVNPNVDMEEIYGQIHPASYTKAAYQAYGSAKATVGYGLSKALDNIKDIWNGDYSRLYNNDEAKAMADIFLQAQTEVPLYYSSDRSEAAKFGHELVAASGSVFGSIIDGIASSAAISLGGSVASFGAGSIPAVGAGVTKLAGTIGKINNFLKANQALKQASNAALKMDEIASGYKTLKGFSDVARTSLATYLSINGEAALQAELNKRQFLEGYIKDFQDQHGRVPTEEELAKIHTEADNLQASTYVQNLILVGASTLTQIPAILSGKIASQKAANSLYKIVSDEAGVRAVKKNLGWQTAKNILQGSIAEGTEEFLQSVIDDATTNYYRKRLNNESIDYISQFTDSLGIIENPEVRREFLIGALLGGSVQTVSTIPQLINSSSNVEDFNSNNKNVLDLFRNDVYINEKLDNTEDADVTNSLLNEKIFNIASKSYDMKTHTNRREYIEEVGKIPAENLSQQLGVEITEAQKESVVQEMLEIYDLTIQTKENADLLFNINPIIGTNWFKNIEYNLGGNSIPFANQLYNDLKDLYVENIVKQNELQKQISAIRDVIIENSLLDESITAFLFNYNRSMLENVLSIEQALKELGTQPELVKKLEKVEKNNIFEKLSVILEHNKVTDIGLEQLAKFNKLYISEKMFADEIIKLTDPTQQKIRMKEIADFYLAQDRTIRDNPTRENNKEVVVDDLSEDNPAPEAAETAPVERESTPEVKTPEESILQKEAIPEDVGEEVETPKEVKAKRAAVESELNQEELQAAFTKGMNTSVNESLNALPGINEDIC